MPFKDLKSVTFRLSPFIFHDIATPQVSNVDEEARSLADLGGDV